MLAGMIAGAMLVIAVVLLSRLRHTNPEQRALRAFAALGLVIAGIVVAVALYPGSGDADTEAADSFGSGQIAWSDVERASSSLREGPSRAATAMQAPSVPSLITGLERRLEAQPDDAGGWALLAQSYAFTGQAELAEQALSRAVTLGGDETDLRERVASATRDPHAGLPAAQTAAR